MLNGLLGGFHTAFSMSNLLACFMGCIMGTLVGVLPGIGPIGAMGLLLPFTYALDPTGAIVMMAGIYYGSMYGGSTTSILLKVPGEAASMVTCFDGYEMAKQGRAGAALSAAAIGSWIAGTIGLVGLMIFAPSLAKLALAFGPPEYIAISIFGLVLLSNLTGASPIRSYLVATLGLFLGCIGMDNISGLPRFTFGNMNLVSGLEIVPLIMGLYGVAEIFTFLEESQEERAVIPVRFRDLYPTREELKRILPPSLRGSVLGFLIGLIPGPAVVIASLLSYKVERKISKNSSEFGTGVIEGVAGPESANNSATAGAMVPLLALGIPFAPATAMLISGFMIHGVAPGPLFITQHAAMFWAIIASMYIGNVILLVLNLPLVGVFASILRVKSAILMPIVLLLCMVGAFGINNSIFDIGVMLVFGIIGYLFNKINLDASPLVVGFILGPQFETAMRQSLVMMGGNVWQIAFRPISGTLLLIAVLSLAFTMTKYFLRKRYSNAC
jgi:putative tricarboxylic transport membrane protein